MRRNQYAIGALLAAFVAAIVYVPATPIRAQSQQATLFNGNVLHEVRLLINSRDLRLLRDRYLENFYVPADLIWQGQRVRNVGVRSRGTGSRNPVKLGLNVQFDRYTRGQRFQGLRSLVLDNSWQDPSFMRESLAMAVFRRMGQPAPRASFAKLYINNEYQGLYSLVEPIDEIFVETNRRETNGRLFEYRYTMPFFTEYLGDDLGSYKTLFEPRTDSTDTDAMLYGPIRDLFRAVNEPDEDLWRAEVEARIDLPQFLTHVAIQGVLADNDGILGYAGLNNFYLYRDAGTNRHRVFPWDEDFAFAFDASSILRRGEQPVVLFERAYAQPDLRTFFLDVAEATASAIDDEGWLQNEVERIASLIAQAVTEDTKKQYSTDAFLTDLEFLRAFAANRGAMVRAEVSSLR